MKRFDSFTFRQPSTSTVDIQEALKGMTVDVIEQLTNGMKILNSSTADLEDKVIISEHEHEQEKL